MTLNVSTAGTGHKEEQGGSWDPTVEIIGGSHEAVPP